MKKQEMFEEMAKGFNSFYVNQIKGRTQADHFYGYKVKARTKARFEEVYNHFLSEKKKIENGEKPFKESLDIEIPNDINWQIKQLSRFCLDVL